MSSTEKTSLAFYQKTGELFYAIAAADKVVRKSEYQSLKKMVQSDWKDLDDLQDEYGVDAAYQLKVWKPIYVLKALRTFIKNTLIFLRKREKH
jgi:hypothetical protein